MIVGTSFFYSVLEIDANQRTNEAVIMQKLQDSIYRVEVVQKDVDVVTKEMKQIKYIKWKEAIKVDRYFGILNSDFESFSNDLKEIAEFPEKECKELRLMHRHLEAGDTKHFEMTFENRELSVRYALFALSKRGDKTDIIYTIYSLEAEQAPRLGSTTTQSAMRNTGFFSWFSSGNATVPTTWEPIAAFSRVQDDDKLKSYFRHKAIDGFSGEGLVDRTKLKYK